MPPKPQFRISLHRPGYHESADQFPPELNLPASPAELQDLLDRARIDGPCQPYKIGIQYCRLDFLRYKLDGQPLKLLELNYLAERLAALSDHDLDVLEGLMQVHPLTPTPTLLINLTHTVGDVAIAYGICNDEQLGKWCVENDMVEEIVNLPEGVMKYLDHAKIGKERREDEVGAFTEAGYVVNLNWPHISDAYDPEHPPWAELDASDIAALVVDFDKYNFAAEEMAGRPIRAELPLPDADYRAILDELDCMESELLVTPVSCLIPDMMINIDTTEKIGALNAFAVCCAGLHAQGKLPLYKAVLEATHCGSLSEAATYGVHINDYQLDPSITSPAQYAEKELGKQLGASAAANLARLENLEYYGRDLEETGNVRVTSYGYLTRVDGGPILAQGSHNVQEEPVHEQTMG